MEFNYLRIREMKKTAIAASVLALSMGALGGSAPAWADNNSAQFSVQLCSDFRSDHPDWYNFVWGTNGLGQCIQFFGTYPQNGVAALCQIIAPVFGVTQGECVSSFNSNRP